MKKANTVIILFSFLFISQLLSQTPTKSPDPIPSNFGSITEKKVTPNKIEIANNQLNNVWIVKKIEKRSNGIIKDVTTSFKDVENHPQFFRISSNDILIYNEISEKIFCGLWDKRETTHGAKIRITNWFHNCLLSYMDPDDNNFITFNVIIPQIAPVAEPGDKSKKKQIQKSILNKKSHIVLVKESYNRETYYFELEEMRNCYNPFEE